MATTASAIIFIFLLLSLCHISLSLIEQERIEEYHRRNYTWPIENYIPSTEGWNFLMDRRFAQISQIKDSGERYEGLVN